MNWRIILWPLSLPYGWITALRNLFFDLGWTASKAYPLPIICIGNLSTGGTGKTPMTEFVLKNIKPGNGGMVSRGYGRKTKGLIIANSNSTVEEIGDEPFQIFQKFPRIEMALAEKRTLGIDAILKSNKVKYIVLDDAFQHRHVKASFSILLATFQKPFYSDLILPAGNLRESKKGVSRADVVVITKCPSFLIESQAQAIRVKIPNKKVFFSTIKYGGLVGPQDFVDQRGESDQHGKSNQRNELDQRGKSDLGGQSNERDHSNQTTQTPIKTLALTGIANPKPFLDHLKNKYEINEHWKYPDHHSFSKSDIENIAAYLKSDRSNQIITTEKDWVRLKSQLDANLLKRIFYLPIELKILFGEEENFKGLIEEHIQLF